VLRSNVCRSRSWWRVATVDVWFDSEVLGRLAFNDVVDLNCEYASGWVGWSDGSEVDAVVARRRPCVSHHVIGRRQAVRWPRVIEIYHVSHLLVGGRAQLEFDRLWRSRVVAVVGRVFRRHGQTDELGDWVKDGVRRPRDRVRLLASARSKSWVSLSRPSRPVNADACLYRTFNTITPA